MNWETIDGYHFRAKVPGGWLVKVLEDVVQDTEFQGRIPGWDYRIALAFVPDPEHEWSLTP